MLVCSAESLSRLLGRLPRGLSLRLLPAPLLHELLKPAAALRGGAGLGGPFLLRNGARLGSRVLLPPTALHATGPRRRAIALRGLRTHARTGLRRRLPLRGDAATGAALLTAGLRAGTVALAARPC